MFKTDLFYGYCLTQNAIIVLFPILRRITSEFAPFIDNGDPFSFYTIDERVRNRRMVPAALPVMVPASVSCSGAQKGNLVSAGGNAVGGGVTSFFSKFGTE